jgi:hypothetical protein
MPAFLRTRREGDDQAEDKAIKEREINEPIS